MSVEALDLASWQPRGAPAVLAWLNRRPWLAEGGMRRLAVAEAPEEDVYEWLRRIALMADDGASDLRVRRVRLTPEDDVLAALADALGAAPPTGSARDRCAQLGRLVTLRPVVFVLSLAGAPGAEELLASLASDLLRSPARANLTAVLLGRDWPLVADDFLYGEPAVASWRVDPDDWGAYVRARFAWESGGHLDAVKRGWAQVEQGLLRGDDNGLERRLNEHARERWTTLSPTVRPELVRCLVSARALPTNTSMTLRRDGALVPWALKDSWRAAPWAARAALLEDEAHANDDRLRRLLVCVPLAQALLGRCIELEHEVRSLGVPLGVPRAETATVFERYQRPSTSDGRRYPSDTPALPRSAWSFATLGELLEAQAPSSRAASVFHDLRGLRNHLAHGHYVSWHTLQDLRRIEAGLG